MRLTRAFLLLPAMMCSPLLAGVAIGEVGVFDKCMLLGSATISGSVNAQDTQLPLPGVVFAAPATPPETLDVFGLGQVMPDGSYSIIVPAPATYILLTIPFGTQYAPELYDSVVSNSAAMRIPVDVGDVVTGIDFTLVHGGTIRGRVTAEDSGLPLAGVFVFAEPFPDFTGFGVGAEGTVTDGSGDYTLGGGSLAGIGLAAADYRVSFFPGGFSSITSTDDYLDEVYDDKIGFLLGDSISVGPQENVTGIDAALALGGRVEGRVTGPGGVPVEDVNVTVFAGVALNHHESDGSAWTDANGDYSIVVPSGSFRVEVDNTDDLAGEWYDDKPEFDFADFVNVAAPATTSGIDVQLAPGGKISGQVTDVNTGLPIPFTYVLVLNAGRGSEAEAADAETDALGNYTTNALPSGDYKVLFFGPEPDLSGLGVYYRDGFYKDASTLAAGSRVTVVAPNTTPNIDQALVPCRQSAPTTTMVNPTTTVTTTTTTTTTTSTTSTTVTTTSTTVTTSTTLPGGGVCGDPVAPLSLTGTVTRVFTASDALVILRVAVGSGVCELCVCDVNDSGGVTATDALSVLKVAVGQPIPLSCPPCA